MRGNLRLQQVIYKLVGTRGGGAVGIASPLPHGGSDAAPLPPSSRKPPMFHCYSDNASICNEIAQHRLVFLGEIHSQPAIIAFQNEIQTRMCQNCTRLHVVLEYFSFEMDSLLQSYQNGDINFEQLVERYRIIGTENHNLEPYRDFLEYARDHRDQIQLHAGFLPRTYARLLMREGAETAIRAASQWLPSQTMLNGTDFHYNIFESLLTGRRVYDNIVPDERFRGIFQAQLLKDIAMAHRVNQLLKDSINGEKFLIIAGNGHLMHYCGVPERVLKETPAIASDSCLVVAHSSVTPNFADDETLLQELENVYGNQVPGDYVFMYRNEDEDVKDETKKAYNKVADTAHLQGNVKKAKFIMQSMGYTDEQIEIAGQDIYNFQGVGNPHKHSNIQPGDQVLDIGSGLGVDSFIAAAQAGPSGRVVGIDISQKEVNHATSRAAERGIQNVEFMVADMEKLPFDDETFDVVISNGAFCLAPNKEKSFTEIYRVLKPGGRMSICTSTIIVDELDKGVSWPLWMRMFIAKDKIQPLCVQQGFTDVSIDESDSSMTIDIPEELLGDDNAVRNKVHVGSEEFKHLKDYNMDQICARVCVVGKKQAQAPNP